MPARDFHIDTVNRPPAGIPLQNSFRLPESSQDLISQPLAIRYCNPQRRHKHTSLMPSFWVAGIQHVIGNLLRLIVAFSTYGSNIIMRLMRIWTIVIMPPHPDAEYVTVLRLDHQPDFPASDLPLTALRLSCGASTPPRPTADQPSPSAEFQSVTVRNRLASFLLQAVL